jgi:puromycin-sensitive aminopeptidase
LDGLKNSHPIEVEVRSPAEVDEIFDAISYSKGASIIRMLHAYIGDDVRGFKCSLKDKMKFFLFRHSEPVYITIWINLNTATH